MEIPSKIYECLGFECAFFKYCNKNIEDGCILECSYYYDCVKDEEEIINLVISLIEKVPEEMCGSTSWESIYGRLLYTLVISDNLINKLLKKYFAVDELGIKVFNELLNQNEPLKSKIQKMWQIINEIKQKLSETTIQEECLNNLGLTNQRIPNKYLNLVTVFLIQDKLVKKYSSIWMQEYDKNFDFQRYHKESGFLWRRDYARKCISQMILSKDDMRGIISMSYFLSEKSKFYLHEWWESWAYEVNVLVDIQTCIQYIKQNDENIMQSHIVDNEDLDKLLDQLNSLVGLYDVKKDVSSLINLLKIRRMREERGLKQTPMSLHLVFSGNPGTGKTTVARLLAKIYHELGIVSKGQLVEVNRSGLVAGYVGQTAIKVQEVIQKALGGILFIDEAYSLTVNRSASDFGFEVVDTLLKGMEDYRDDLIVIVAGYPDLMNDFLNSNPGLRSRFNKFIHFVDYTPQELLGIFKNLCNASGYTATSTCLECVKKYFEKRCTEKGINFANGRDVRNYFEMAMVNQANRLSTLSNISDKILSELNLEDVQNIII